MNLEEIKTAVKAGLTVHWSNIGYVVVKDQHDQFLIHCLQNDNYIGLTHQDGETMNGKESEFFLGGICLSDLDMGDTQTACVQLADEYFVKFDGNPEYLIVKAGACFPQAGTQFKHSNWIALKDEVCNTRAYWPSGRKKWFSHATRTFYFCIRGHNVRLVKGKCGYSYIPAILGNDFRTSFSVSGGTSPNGWTDHLDQITNIGIGCPQRKLKQIADIAMPLDEVRALGITLDLAQLEDREDKQFRRLRASHLMRANMRVDETTIWLDSGVNLEVLGPYKLKSWQRGKANIMGSNGTVWRTKGNQIDWLKTAEANGVDVPGPAMSTHFGQILQPRKAG